MNKNLSKKYQNVILNDNQIKMIAENICKPEIIEVLKLIKKNTQHIKNPNGYGITKKEIQNKVMVKSSTLNKQNGKYKEATIKMTRHMCDNIISILSGATLIYFDDSHGRGKRYHLTIRGAMVYKYLMNIGVIKENDK